ncbi:alpha/beta hydrolase [Clostridium swellfunianum]|uniref:alpha/beta fold hydrolase n=1 Tax=Clostridium swellfunianum TaxID=1367462 RepID=UPI0020300D46|nr:alpha/beta hydrolase [Clostridium swellfunianum]MCM0650192.1 alpha/beta hydrolase [Clostridium swellfunianum]
MVSLLEKVVLGHTKQWILARGSSEQNSIILFLHGGPGLPMMPFHQHFQRDIEDKYLVVHWDQRGAGKSYSEDIPADSMNLSQLLSDAQELVHLLKKKYKKDKIYLAGHSWGTILGINLVHNHPEDFYGFISIGQVVDFSQALNISHAFALGKAKQQGCEEAVNELIGIGEPPFNVDDTKLSIILKNVGRFGGRMHNEISFPSIAKKCEEYTEEDIENIPKGLAFSDIHLWKEVINSRMMDNYLEFEIPIYFLCGKYDYITPTVLVEEYCKKINAPVKKVIVLENSAHFPYIEEPKAFSKAIIDILESHKDNLW